MDANFWIMAIGSLVSASIACAYGFYEVRKFDKRFGKDVDRKP